MDLYAHPKVYRAPIFPIITDHKALKAPLMYKEDTGGLERWRLHLFVYDFDLQSRKAARYELEDTLVLLEISGQDTAEIAVDFLTDLTLLAIAGGH